MIDPSNPNAVRPEPTPPPPEPQPIFEAPRAVKEPEETPSQTAGLYFPPTTAFPSPRVEREDDEARFGRRAPRPRPSAEQKKSKRSTEPAEPGDEPIEASWMEGLSNRLSAYSLSEDEQSSAADAEDDEEKS